MKKNLSSIFFFMIGFILFLFFFPLVEGFEECMVDTLANMKIELSSLRKEVDELKDSQPSTQSSAQTEVANSELASNTADTYNELNDISDAPI